MKILTHTRLQGATWSTFQPPLKGQAGHESTGIFLRCAALCWGSSWAGREEPGFLHLTTEIEDFQPPWMGDFYAKTSCAGLISNRNWLEESFLSSAKLHRSCTCFPTAMWDVFPFQDCLYASECPLWHTKNSLVLHNSWVFSCNFVQYCWRIKKKLNMTLVLQLFYFTFVSSSYLLFWGQIFSNTWGWNSLFQNKDVATLWVLFNSKSQWLHTWGDCSDNRTVFCLLPTRNLCDTNGGKLFIYEG